MNYRRFSNPAEMCDFIDRIGYRVIQIVYTPCDSYPYILFFGDKEEKTDGSD